jgi:hypothetical protein
MPGLRLRLYDYTPNSALRPSGSLADNCAIELSSDKETIGLPDCQGAKYTTGGAPTQAKTTITSGTMAWIDDLQKDDFDEGAAVKWVRRLVVSLLGREDAGALAAKLALAPIGWQRVRKHSRRAFKKADWNL